MKRSVHIVCTLLASAAIGCSGDGFEDEGGDDGADQGQADAIEAGEYFLIDLPTSDKCGVAGSTETDVELVDIKVTDGGKKLAYKEDDTPISCDANGKGGYDCTADEPGLKFPELDVETVVTGKVTWRKVGDRLEGDYSAELACKGSGCEALSHTFPFGLPCKSEGKYIGVRTMPENFAPQIGAYKATVGKATLNTCNVEPSVAANQSIDIRVKDDGTAEVFSGDDPTPHSCRFAGKGRTECFRLVENDDDTESFAQVHAAWTSATSFEGNAVLEMQCADGGDCSASEFGELPCFAVYHVEGAAAPAGAN